jgi:[ribosomal protein S5]-alanine N-acetyltransferase
MLQSDSTYFMKTPRLGFRTWSADDQRLAVALWGDADVTRLIGGLFSETRVQDRLRSELASMETHRVQYWPVFLLDNGDFVGCCGLHAYKPEEQICELGFHLRPAHWGSGLATEAGRKVIEHAFNSLKARKLFAGHHPENLNSKKVLEKLGFRFTHEELYPPTGKLHRCYLLESPR